MIKYIIIDDEPLAREGMILNCEQIPFLKKMGSFENAIKATTFLGQEEVDLIFLDIEMPGLNGLEFLRVLQNPPQVVLCTAYPQYALESYELDVIDYLIKPIKFDRFFKAVNKVKEYLDLKSKAIFDVDAYEEAFMYIKADRKFIKIYYDEVLYIKGMKDYVVIHTAKQKYMTAMNIKTILKQLPAKYFARIAKSYVVQVKQVTSVSIDSVLLNKLEIPLGPSFKERFIEDYVKTNLISR